MLVRARSLAWLLSASCLLASCVLDWDWSDKPKGEQDGGLPEQDRPSARGFDASITGDANLSDTSTGVGARPGSATCTACSAACPDLCAAVGEACAATEDCASQVCEGNLCRPVCSGHCELTEACAHHDDCTSQSCVENRCRAACSGSCATGATCSEDDDCSSGSCGTEACLPGCSGECALGEACVSGTDCASSQCKGTTCRPACTGSCATGQPCVANDDCSTSICVSGTCRTTCSGSCPLGAPCTEGLDCASNRCTGNVCRPACANSCGLGSECVVSGDCANSGKCTNGTCRPSCSPNCTLGSACSAAADCASGLCEGGICRPSCAPSCGQGNACASAGDCASNKCTNGTCRPSCAESCAAGQSCVADSDCAGGGTCHPTDKICLVSCPAAVVTTPDQVNDRRFCREIAGKLSITAGTSLREIKATDFPYLVRIRGNLEFLQSLYDATFTALTTIDGALSLGGSLSNLQNAIFPNLRTVGTAGASPVHGIYNSATIVRIEMPLLVRVNGDLNLFYTPTLERAHFPSLTTITHTFQITYSGLVDLDLASLTRVGGNCDLFGLPELPYSSVAKLNDPVTGNDYVGGTVNIEAVGCCHSFGQDHYRCDGYACQ